jgi:TIR domain
MQHLEQRGRARRALARSSDEQRAGRAVGPSKRHGIPSSAMSGPSIFISFGHEDAGLAQALAHALRRRRCRVWIDARRDARGRFADRTHCDGHREVEFVVALVSEASVESNWCKKELSLAITGGLGREGEKVLPLRVGDVEMPRRSPTRSARH